MEMASGHGAANADSTANSISPRRAGDATGGQIIVRGASGAATMPMLSCSGNLTMLTVRAAGWVFRDFQVQNTNGTKTASAPFSSTSEIVLKNIRCIDGTNKFWKFFTTFGTINKLVIEDCNIQNCANIGIDLINNAANGNRIVNNRIMLCGSHGINRVNNITNITTIRGNIIAFNAGSGIFSNGNTSAVQTWTIIGNVIHGNAVDGIQFSENAGSAGSYISCLIEDNEITFNGTSGSAYGIDFNGTGYSDAALTGARVVIRNNAFFGNRTDKYLPTTLTISENELTTDPSGGLASTTKDYAGTVSGDDFRSSVHAGKGYPAGGSIPVGGKGGTSTNNPAIGLDPVAASGSAGMLYIPTGDGT
jgi:hypothetical protein